MICAVSVRCSPAGPLSQLMSFHIKTNSFLHFGQGICHLRQSVSASSSSIRPSGSDGVEVLTVTEFGKVSVRLSVSEIGSPSLPALTSYLFVSSKSAISQANIASPVALAAVPVTRNPPEYCFKLIVLVPSPKCLELRPVLPRGCSKVNISRISLVFRIIGLSFVFDQACAIARVGCTMITPHGWHSILQPMLLFRISVLPNTWLAIISTILPTSRSLT